MDRSDLLGLATSVARELESAGASAVVLAGSHARGDAHELSDIDLYAIGVGARYVLRAVDGRLVAISWRTENDERRALRDPATVGAAVPAWRTALVLVDRAGVAGALQREARQFAWSTIASECDVWVADQVVGYTEEVLKLVAARRAGDVLGAAVQRAVLALRLPGVMAVQRRLLYETENRLWRLVSDVVGPEWAAAQEAALDAASADDGDAAALTLFTMAVDEAAPLLSAAQSDVIDLARRAIEDDRRRA